MYECVCKRAKEKQRVREGGRERAEKVEARLQGGSPLSPLYCTSAPTSAYARPHACSLCINRYCWKSMELPRRDATRANDGSSVTPASPALPTLPYAAAAITTRPCTHNRIAMAAGEAGRQAGCSSSSSRGKSQLPPTAAATMQRAKDHEQKSEAGEKGREEERRRDGEGDRACDRRECVRVAPAGRASIRDEYAVEIVYHRLYQYEKCRRLVFDRRVQMKMAAPGRTVARHRPPPSGTQSVGFDKRVASVHIGSLPGIAAAARAVQPSMQSAGAEHVSRRRPTSADAD